MKGPQVVEALKQWRDEGWAAREAVQEVISSLESILDAGHLDKDFELGPITKRGNRGISISWVQNGAVVSIWAEPRK